MFQTFNRVFPGRFLGIISISFSRGSVWVNSVVRLSGTASADERNVLRDNMASVFKNNGFDMDINSFSFEPTKGTATCRSL